MSNSPKIIAIIGATASGKSDLALQKASETDSLILSLDSLSVYKEIDIASAKPNKYELSLAPHHGINEIYPDEEFNASIFIDLYKQVSQQALQENKQLIIVGGTSFYLKSLFTGLSVLPEYSDEVVQQVQNELLNPEKAFNLLQNIDSEYTAKISVSDTFRIEKGLLLYFATKIPPTQYFQENQPVPIISFEQQKNIDIYKIERPRDKLRERIKLRTEIMLKNGLLDEVFYLAKKYKNLELKPFKSIGIKETIDYFQSKIETKEKLIELISLHTGQFAKRQDTFNRTQFKNLNIIDV